MTKYLYLSDPQSFQLFVGLFPDIIKFVTLGQRNIKTDDKRIEIYEKCQK